MVNKWIRPSLSTETLAGGFTLLRSHALLALWQAYRVGYIRLIDVRIAFAWAELRHQSVASVRRAKALPGRGPVVVTNKPDCHCLQQLTVGSCPRKVRAALKRLSNAGVPPEHLFGRTEAPMPMVLEPIQNIADRPVPMPRRLLRHLAGQGTASDIAVSIGHLLRGSYLKRGLVHIGGTCSAAWIASTFGVDERTAKSGRRELVQAGWLVVAESPDWHRQRFGASFLFNPEWSPPHKPVPDSPPRHAQIVPGVPPPRKNKNLPLRGIRNQDRDSGSCKPDRATNCEHSVRREAVHGTRPTMRNVIAADLEQPRRTLQLLEDALRHGLIGSSDAERLRFFTTVQHAKDAGLRPCALFASLARKRLWTFGNQHNEDRAQTILQKLRDDGNAHVGELQVSTPARSKLPCTGRSSHGRPTRLSASRPLEPFEPASRHRPTCSRGGEAWTAGSVLKELGLGLPALFQSRDGQLV